MNMDLFFSSEYEVMWGAIGTIADGLASILAMVALIYTITTFKKSMQASHYSELDSAYFELLKTALEKPHLANNKSVRTEEQAVEYDIYAFMVWNFLEAVYDRCENDSHLCGTWYPVILSENKRHREWFDHPDNKIKFKIKFKDFIIKSLFELPHNNKS